MSKLPVVCIGNFTVGGAGKTPVAMKLAAIFIARGLKPAFLSRGYGGHERGPYLVDLAHDGADKVGDEPLLLAQMAPAVISRDRRAGAKLIERLGVDIILMDDGFQNPSLKKDFSLVVVDGASGIGSGRVFPLGPLRAPLAFQFEMADAIVILGRQNGAAIGAVRSHAAPRSKGIPVFEATIEPVVTSEIVAKPLIAFCGIGRPAKFFDTLKTAGAEIVKAQSFPDHHVYTREDARMLLQEAKSRKASLITTEKDHVRLARQDGPLDQLHRATMTLPIKAEFTANHEANLINAIEERLERQIKSSSRHEPVRDAALAKPRR